MKSTENISRTPQPPPTGLGPCNGPHGLAAGRASQWGGRQDPQLQRPGPGCMALQSAGCHCTPRLISPTLPHNHFDHELQIYPQKTDHKASATATGTSGRTGLCQNGKTTSWRWGWPGLAKKTISLLHFVYIYNLGYNKPPFILRGYSWMLYLALLLL